MIFIFKRQQLQWVSLLMLLLRGQTISFIPGTNSVPLYSGTNLYQDLVPLYSGTEFVPGMRGISTTI